MSHQVERDEGRDVLDTGGDRGDITRGSMVRPSEQFSHDHALNHCVLIHEDDADRYTAAIPFIGEGLDRGECCVYVVDRDTSEREKVIDALREIGIDVNQALDTGDLVFYTAQETYLRTQPFDPASMVAFYADMTDELAAEYDGLRVVAATDWIEHVSIEEFMEYEGRVNALFEDHDTKALCMYDRTQLPSSVIPNVIRTHPHLIYDGTFCEDFYYTSPEEFFGTGIGLALCQEIVDQHSGSIGVESEPGKGTTFTATHPRRGSHCSQD